jgi:hypothetical protein
MFSEWATLSCKYQLPWGEKMFGFISSMAVIRIAEEKLLQENEKNPGFIIVNYLGGGQNKHTSS